MVDIKALILALLSTNNFDFVTMATALLRPPPFQVAPDVAEHFLSHLVEVASLSMMSCIPLALLSDLSTATGGSAWTPEKRQLSAQWRAGVARVGLEATLWCEQTAVPLLVSSTKGDAAAIPRTLASYLRRLLLLDTPSTECFRSPESAMASLAMHKLLPIEEDTIIRVILLRLKLGPQIGLSPDAALSILDDLFVRAARYGRFVRLYYVQIRERILAELVSFFQLNTEERQSINPLKISNMRIHEALFRLAVAVEATEGGVALAWKPSFFRVCQMLVVAAALNHKTVGRVIWDQLPTARLIIEMLITQNFAPTDSALLASQESIHELDQKAALAANRSDTFDLVRLDLAGPARLPPDSVIKALIDLDKALLLAPAFCSSRDPDFVLSLLQRNPPTTAPTWVGSVIQADPGAVAVIPAKTLVQIFHQYCCGQFRQDDNGPSSSTLFVLVFHFLIPLLIRWRFLRCLLALS